MNCGPLVGRFVGLRTQVPKIESRCATCGTTGASEPRAPLTLSSRPSGKYTVSKKHSVGTRRCCEPVMRSSVPGASISGVMPLRVNCVTP